MFLLGCGIFIFGFLGGMIYGRMERVKKPLAYNPKYIMPTSLPEAPAEITRRRSKNADENAIKKDLEREKKAPRYS